MTNRLRMQSLAAQFSSDPNLSADNRLLEKEGFVKMKEKKDKWAQRKLFLFNGRFFSCDIFVLFFFLLGPNKICLLLL